MACATAVALLAAGGGHDAQAAQHAQRADAGAPPAPVQLTVGDRARPLDVEGTPRFGWQDRGLTGRARQAAYELRVQRAADGATVWDSDRVASSQQSFVPYGGPALDPDTSYTWSVRVWGDGGHAPSDWADAAAFDTGISDQQWSGAQWIRRTTTGNDSLDDYTLARKQVDVADSPVTRARAYVSAQGQYELHVSGRDVYRGDNFDYPGEGQYSSTDITDAVQAGKPLALGVLYHYWTCTCQGRANGPASPEGPSGLLVKVVVDHADGTTQTFVSDGSWKVNKAAQYTTDKVTYRNGDAGDRVERYDARKEIADWDAVGFDDGAWQPATVIGAHPRPVNPKADTFSHLDPAISGLTFETVHPDSLRTLADGTVIADFGHVLAAKPQLALHDGASGRALTMHTTYRLGHALLTAPVAAGDTTLHLSTTAGFVAGDPITVDAPANGHGAGDPETRTVAAVGADGTSVTLDQPVARAHAAKAWVEGARAGTSKLDTQGSDMSWSYVEKDGAQTARTFTYWGWRYLQIDAPGAGETLTKDDISAVVQHTDAPAERQATFASDNPTLDGVFTLMQRSGLESSQETHLDTPTREKGQFLGDTIDISWANLLASGERNATARAIREFVYSGTHSWKTASKGYCNADQVPCSYPSLGTPGRLNSVYPNGDNMRDIPDYTEWFPMWVWQYYQQSADGGTLGSAYATMQAVAQYLKNNEATSGNAAGLIYNLTGGTSSYANGIIDWPAPMRYGYTFANDAARTIHNAEAVGAFRATAQAARALGHDDQAAQYDGWADDLTRQINAKLVRADGLYTDGLSGDPGNPQIANSAEHAQSYPIYFGIAPAAQRAALADELVRQGMRQGPMTWHVLLAALHETGRDDQLVKLLTDASADGPAKILAEGGTFMWEQWDPGCTTVAPCDNPDENDNTSFSHGWGSWGVADMVESLLGVSVSGPGAATIVIAPPALSTADLHEVRGSAWTQRGTVTVQWQRTARGVRLVADVPSNVTATVRLPVVDGARYVAAGQGDPQDGGTQDGRAVYTVGGGKTTFVPVPKGHGHE